MKKAVLFIAALIIAVVSMAQIVLNVQLPSSGLKMKSQLWNISLINPAGAGMQVRMEMIMADAVTNQPVLSAVTGTFLLPPGAKQVTVSDVMPVVYNATGAAGYNIDVNPDGFLPVGLFTVCYSVTTRGRDGHGPLAESCETIQVEPLSPPRLITPVDSEYVELKRPVFTWTPPSPPMLFSLLTYDWVLVEVQPFQLPAEAVQQNIPLWKQQDVIGTSLQYPESLPALDTSKLYAWEIVAKNNFSAVSKSEVWTFRVKQTGRKVSVMPEYYARLKRQEDASFIICSGLLHYEYMNEVNDSTVHLAIYDITGSVHQPVLLRKRDFAVRAGQNYMQMDLQSNGRFSDRHIYLFELANDRGQRWYLKFEYRKQD